MTTFGNSSRFGTSSALELCLGGNTFGWTSSREVSFEVLDSFTGAGGSLIDTADSYSAWVEGNSGGESETIIGQWLAARGNRDDVVLATKVSQHPEFKGLAPKNVAAAAEATLRRLGTDHIDLYYAHFDDEQTPLEETVGAFEELITAGRIRAVGVSNYSADRVRQWFEIARREGYTLPVALQPHYNLVHRGDYESGLSEIARAEDLAVMPYFSLASGFLTGKYRNRTDLEGAARAGMAGKHLSEQKLRVLETLDAIASRLEVAMPTVALAWLRTRDQVTAPIASARTPEQLPALLAGARLQLSAEDAQALTAVSSAVED
ncbi:aldo/keto reductase [Nesterenkonia lutea]|uniref:Aryl-alcohol dehydrogenase (NADP+) n=1 Tax=Nesterenkonia lutea TaxID=272919 RepID=A0ABR9JC84_9MICC|nr:aldo/keto reductase [Nesterenkonia lutea]MBE1523547.1 aryl-alcohol dehydrogenase (NADP+) [Nesterenkonia lutea]